MKKIKFKNTIFICDTQILQYIDSVELSGPITKLLEELRQQEGNTINISEYTVMEALTGTGSDREQQVLKIIDTFERYLADVSVLKAAAQLYSIYKEDGQNVERISPGDRVIASTAILLSNAIVITANGKDFPRPFFREEYAFDVPYRGGSITVYLLRPNVDLINKRFQNRRK